MNGGLPETVQRHISVIANVHPGAQGQTTRAKLYEKTRLTESDGL